MLHFRLQMEINLMQELSSILLNVTLPSADGNKLNARII